VLRRHVELVEVGVAADYGSQRESDDLSFGQGRNPEAAASKRLLEVARRSENARKSFREPERLEQRGG